MNRKGGRLDLGLFLLATGALSNITIWIGAFVSTETAGPVNDWVRAWFLPILGGLSGLSMGITVAIGLVFVIVKLNEMKPTIERKVRGKDETTSRPNVRYYTGWGAFVLLLVISPALLSPYVYMTISGSATLFMVLGERWAGLWAVGRIVAADLAMGAVALVYGVHLPSSAPATPVPQSGSQTPPRAKGAKKTAKELRKCDVPGCGIAYTWPQGKGAHYKQYHKDLVIHKAIPAKVSLPIEDGVK
jgi:hypothetical protein